IAGIKNIIIVQNKVDLVDEKQALENYNKIKEFVKGSIAEDAPIIPVSAQHRANIDVLLSAILDIMVAPKRDEKCDPKMYVARSFDVNKPSTEPKNLVGGIIGGTLVEGRLKVNDEIELRPGIKVDGKWRSVTTKVMSIAQGSHSLKEGTPGGLLAVGTLLDPYISKSDSIVGNIAGHVGKLPEVRHELKLEVHLIERVVGLSKDEQVKRVLENDVLMMNAGTAKTVGVCNSAGNVAGFKLKIPVCADAGDKVALSKQINGRWRLIGYGIIK
ncbi:MAG: translation initiation factor IF-2 subunit gamma, partial [archaeon]|nr:translation initiation factor IF-2 subunit gamma [archaeon]